MTEQALRKMIAAGESTRQEFKSWVKCKDYRQRKELAVKSAVALAKSGHQTGKKSPCRCIFPQVLIPDRRSG